MPDKRSRTRGLVVGALTVPPIGGQCHVMWKTKAFYHVCLLPFVICFARGQVNRVKLMCGDVLPKPSSDEKKNTLKCHNASSSASNNS